MTMLSSEDIDIGGKSLLGVKVDLPGAPVLMLVGGRGFIGCGYFKTEVADKVGHALAVVSGVSVFEDVLAGKVVAVSGKALELGVEVGMDGRAAANLLA
jgi:uncharacterized protein YunC (DUF1805 family)